MSSADSYVTVVAKLRGRYSALTGQRLKCVDHVESDAAQRYSQAADGDEDGEAGVRVSGGRRRRQRAAGGRRKSRLQQQQQPEVMTSPLRRVDAGYDDDDDDTGSVCSGASSASENSTASRGSGGGRTGRRSRGPPRSTRTSSSRRDGSEDAGTRPVTCKCKPDRHIRSTALTHPADDQTGSSYCCGVERPEPEGGVRTATYKSPMSDEFERLIYGPSEPLFSDDDDAQAGKLDDDVDVTRDCTTTITTSTSVRPAQRQRRRFTGAVVGVDESTENLLSAAQMLNTNNMMKFAIIQMELKNVKDVSLRRMESDVTVLCGRLKAACEACSQTVPGLNSAAELHADLSAQLKLSSSGDGDGTSDQQRSSSSTVDGHTRQTAPRCQSTTTTKSYGCVARHLAVTDDDLHAAQARLDAAETRVAQLETELKSVVNSNVSHSNHQHRDKAIRDTTLRLKEAELQANVAESELLRLHRLATRYRDEVTAEVKKYRQISAQLGVTTFADVIGC